MKENKRKYEFHLEDANENEKELITRGTINDKLNTLALLCVRNPSEPNYKQLLSFCENQRNDVIYMTLKLVRDLIKEGKDNVGKKGKNIFESQYICSRIIKSFEMGAKNQYIKDKVVKIIGVLIRSDIFAEEFLDILISRLIEKGSTLTIVENAIKSVFIRYETQIYHALEDFYFKHDNFRNQHGMLKFLEKINLRDSSVKKNFFDFYNQALNTLDEYSEDQKDLMIELIVNGLSATISFEDDKEEHTYNIDKIDLIRKYIKSPRSIISCLRLLMKIGDPFTETYVLKVSRTTLLRNTKFEPEFLNIISKINNKDLFMKLIDNSFHYSVPSILSLMLLGYSKSIDTRVMFSLKLFAMHYNPVIRDIADKIMKKEQITEFDPFDKVFLDGLSRSLQNRK